MDDGFTLVIKREEIPLIDGKVCQHTQGQINAFKEKNVLKSQLIREIQKVMMFFNDKELVDKLADTIHNSIFQKLLDYKTVSTSRAACSLCNHTPGYWPYKKKGRNRRDGAYVKGSPNTSKPLYVSRYQFEYDGYGSYSGTFLKFCDKCFEVVKPIVLKHVENEKIEIHGALTPGIISKYRRFKVKTCMKCFKEYMEKNNQRVPYKSNCCKADYINTWDIEDIEMQKLMNHALFGERST